MNHHHFIGVVGHKKSGKTTLVESLTTEMVLRGKSVGTIKITSHDLEFDSPGKDTHRHRIAGSKATLIKSRSQIALFSDTAYFDDEQIKVIFQKCDFVFIEGDSGSQNPKICVSDDREIRKDIAGEVIAIWGMRTDIKEIPYFDNNEIRKLCDYLLDKYN
jgi:molybdopterin-guanine dinucleotide biosynthesis adapter protein